MKIITQNASLQLNTQENAVCKIEKIYRCEDFEDLLSFARMNQGEDKDCDRYQQIDRSYFKRKGGYKQALYKFLLSDEIKVMFRGNWEV